MWSAARIALVSSLLVGLSVAGSADVVLDWNDKVVAAGIKAGQSPFGQTRSVAIVQVAMFEALNAIDRRYTPYHVKVSTAPGTSREAAASSAAHFALVRLFPDQAKDFDAFYQTSLTAIPDGDPKSNGIRLGEQVATEILALRTKDGADAPNTYRPYTTTGVYVPTAFPAASGWSKVTPSLSRRHRSFDLHLRLP